MDSKVIGSVSCAIQMKPKSRPKFTAYRDIVAKFNNNDEVIIIKLFPRKFSVAFFQ
jgi:hypothetical protein